MSAAATSPAWPAWLELVRRLDGDPELADVAVTPAWSGKAFTANRRVIYGGSLTSADQIVATGVAREETATLEVVCTAWLPGADAGEAIDAARGLAAVVERVLAADPGLSQTVPNFLWAALGSWSQDYDVDDDGAVGVVIQKIELHSYLY